MITEISVADLPAWVAQQRAAGQQPYLLDVRAAWELESATAQAQIAQMGIVFGHTPLSQLDELLETDSLPPKTAPIACLCHHGRRSMAALMMLEQKGYTQLYNIRGGIAAWGDLIPEIGRC